MTEDVRNSYFWPLLLAGCALCSCPRSVAHTDVDKKAPQHASRPTSMPLQQSTSKPSQQPTSQSAMKAVSAAHLERTKSLQVPAALLAQSRFEPSGLLWEPLLQRYLVVSDDTGYDDEDSEAQPWLFTMDVEGNVDPQPLRVENADKVSDLESITRLDAQHYLLLCSQSLSKKGKRPAKRQCMLHVELRGKRLFALQQYDFFSLFVDAAQRGGGTKWLNTLGLGGTRNIADLDRSLQLDIEGIAYRKDALLLGLKEPQNASGQALLWKLENLQTLLRNGRLEPAKLTLTARLNLQVQDAARNFPAGIADILLLDETRMLVAATSPVLESTQTGMVYIVENLALPRAVAAYPGRKPEGLALTPSGDAVVVVFDRGAANPEWSRIDFMNIPTAEPR